MTDDAERRVAIACQGGGSHTAFTAGVLATFAGLGKVGLWTKADSVTAFDDLSIVTATPAR